METTGRRFDPPVAIVGLGGLFPGSPAAADFWRTVVHRRDMIQDVPPHYWVEDQYYDPRPRQWGKTWARRGAFLPKVPFDPLEFGIPPSSLASIDTVQLLTLLVARDALEDCVSYRERAVDPEDVGVILGAAASTELIGQLAPHHDHPTWSRAMREAGLDEDAVAAVVDRVRELTPRWTEDTFPGGLANVTAGRITNRMGLGGTNCIIDAACASSLAALSMAVQELQNGRADLMITGGVDAHSDIYVYMCFTNTPALSPTGDARPFSKEADGTILGEGLGLVALRRLPDAERDGDRIYGVIRGIGSSSDGRAKSIYAPRPSGQMLALRRAYEESGVSPAEVELVEAHGTATQANDAAEYESLSTIYREADGERLQWCALGSVKSQIGHTKAAAGAAALVKTALALHHRVLPPTIKVDEPNPALRLEEGPFYLNTAARPWVHEPSSTRKAALTSLGFGGTNFHVVLEEYRGEAPRPARFRSTEGLLLPLSAADADALDAGLAGMEERLAEVTAGELARELSREFDAGAPLRLALIAEHAGEVPERIAEARRRIAEGGEDVAVPGRMILRSGPPLPVAFLFPGQGSQAVDMGRELAVELEPFREVWDAVTGLEAPDATPLHRVVFPPPALTGEERRAQEERLRDTRYAQPALGATDLAYLAVLGRLGVRPGWVGGHSYGELVALHAAGVLPELEDLLALSRARGELMAEASTRAGASGMTAVLAPQEDVEALLDDGGVTLANVNGPAQVVVAGSLEDLDRFEARVEEAGLRSRRLPVSAGFHSAYVEEAAGALRDRLEAMELRPPSFPVFANATAAPYPDDPGAIRDLLAGQLARPVRFREQVEAMHAAGARVFVEVGPGRVLTNLVGECLQDRQHLAVAMDGRAGSGMMGLLESLAALACAGVPMELERLWADFAEERPRTVRGLSEATLQIDGSNLEKPDPPPPERTPRRGTRRGPGPASTGEAGWASALQEIHSNMTEAQKAYQESLARSHEAFMKASAELLSGLGEEPPADLPLPDGPQEVEAPSERGVAELYAELRDGAVRRTDPDAAGALAARSPEEYQGMMLDVVAELTGYPRSAIDLDLDLEADLGVDSIKKFELLSEFQRRAPEVEVADPVSLLTKRSLREVIDAVQAELDPGAPTGSGEATPGEGADPSSSPLGEEGPVERRVLEAVPVEEGCEALRGLEGRTLHVVEDARGVAAPLVQNLEALGHTARVVSEVPEDAEAVILLSGLDPEAPDPAREIERNRAAFRLARRCGAQLRDSGGVLVTVQDTGGDFNLSGEAGARAWGAGLPALGKTLRMEWPGISFKAIDVDSRGRTPEDLARVIFQELTEGGQDPEVGLRPGGNRIVPTLRPRALSGDSEPLPEGTVVLASGGGRGITAACLVALAQRSPLRIGLLGSTPLGAEGEEDPRGDEVRSTLRALEAAGSEARYLTADVRDVDAVTRAVAEGTEGWGPVQVLLHAAGVNVDTALLEKSEEEFDAVLDTKVLGLRNLLEATREHPLTHLVCFSSIVARNGNLKQADYAMANEVLNKVCQSEARARVGRCRVRSFLWGPWAGGMVKEHHRRFFELVGVPPLELEVGVERFVRELETSDPTDPVEVLLQARPGPGAGDRVH